MFSLEKRFIAQLWEAKSDTCFQLNEKSAQTNQGDAGDGDGHADDLKRGDAPTGGAEPAETVDQQPAGHLSDEHQQHGQSGAQLRRKPRGGEHHGGTEQSSTPHPPGIATVRRALQPESPVMEEHHQQQGQEAYCE